MQLKNTPWGSPQQQHEVAPGIISVSTASHGGYYLDATRFAEFRAIFPKAQLWAGNGWFEEDSDWRLVVLSFPQFFDAAAVRAAVLETMRVARWGQYTVTNGIVSQFRVKHA